MGQTGHERDEAGRREERSPPSGRRVVHGRRGSRRAAARGARRAQAARRAARQRRATGGDRDRVERRAGPGSPSVPSATRTSTRRARHRAARRRACSASSGMRSTEHLGRELGEHRRLVAGARADVEHRSRPGARALADQRDHVRLRDRLAVADRQRRVVVGAAAHLRRDEGLARHARHRREHALVADPAARAAARSIQSARHDRGDGRRSAARRAP